MLALASSDLPTACDVTLSKGRSRFEKRHKMPQSGRANVRGRCDPRAATRVPKRHGREIVASLGAAPDAGRSLGTSRRTGTSWDFCRDLSEAQYGSSVKLFF